MIMLNRRAFAQMLYYLFHDTKLGGGSDGIYIYVKPELTIAGTRLLNLDDPAQFYYLIFGLMLAVYFGLRMILRSPFGHALVGIKANEHRMRSLGFQVFWYKLGAFVLAGMLAGLAGYLAACQFGYVNPEILSRHNSGNVLMMLLPLPSVVRDFRRIYPQVSRHLRKRKCIEQCFGWAKVVGRMRQVMVRGLDKLLRSIPCGSPRERVALVWGGFPFWIRSPSQTASSACVPTVTCWPWAA